MKIGIALGRRKLYTRYSFLSSRSSASKHVEPMISTPSRHKPLSARPNAREQRCDVQRYLHTPRWYAHHAPDPRKLCHPQIRNRFLLELLPNDPKRLAPAAQIRPQASCGTVECDDARIALPDAIGASLTHNVFLSNRHINRPANIR